jgi:hypothetical protein
MISRAIIKTQKAEPYVAQLCKHFRHKVPAEFDGATGWVQQPQGDRAQSKLYRE